MSEDRLRAIEAQIADTKQRQRLEAERKAAEEAARAERERLAAAPGRTLEDLLAEQARLQAEIAAEREREQRQAEWQVISRRAEALAAKIEIKETELQDERAQYAALMAKLG